MKKYILVVDPSKSSRHILRNYLSEKYNVLEAPSYSEAVKLLSGISPSLVIVAYELQDGSGMDLCKYFYNKKTLRSVPMIMISAHDKEEYRKKAYEFGVIDFIHKNNIKNNFGQYIDEMVEIISKSNVKGAIVYTIINDNNDLSFISNILESAKVRCKGFKNSIELFENTLKNPPDIVIAEQIVDNMNIGKFVVKLRNIPNCKHIPVISLIDKINNAFLRTMMIYDINGYLVKPLSSPEEILLKCSSQIKTKWLYDEFDNLNKELYVKATTDPLTGLYNRRHLMEYLEQVFYNIERYNSKCGIMMFDIDFFKKVNDKYGHDVGDLVLIQFANMLKQFIRKSDMFGRFGGEEFVCILNNISEDNFKIVTKKFLDIVRSMVIDTGKENFSITMSIGGTLCSPGSNLLSALKEVDQLLYKSKETGRNRGTLNINGEVITVI